MLIKDHMFMFAAEPKDGDTAVGMCGKGSKTWPPENGEVPGWPVPKWRRPCPKCVHQFALAYDNMRLDTDKRLDALLLIERIARDTK